MNAEQIRKLADSMIAGNISGHGAIDRGARVLRACADVVEAVGSPERLIAPDFDKLHAALAKLEAIAP